MRYSMYSLYFDEIMGWQNEYNLQHGLKTGRNVRRKELKMNHQDHHLGVFPWSGHRSVV